jgi:hypothetical protein
LTVALGALTLLAGLGFRRPAAIAWSILLLAVAYGFTLIGGRAATDSASLPVAGALFLVAELGYLAVEVGYFPGLPLRPMLASLGVALGSIVLGVVVLAMGQSFVVVGPLLTAAGVVAALILLGMVAANAARRTG